jgi:hypothetical protein
MKINTCLERIAQLSRLCSNILEGHGDESGRHSLTQPDPRDTGALFHFSSWPWDKLLNSDIFRAPRESKNHVEHIRKVASRKELLVIPRQKVLSAEMIYNEKRGIWGISQAGRVKVRLISGETLEFVLAGKGDGDALLQQILQDRVHGSTNTNYPVLTHRNAHHPLN